MSDEDYYDLLRNAELYVNMARQKSDFGSLSEAYSLLAIADRLDGIKDELAIIRKQLEWRRINER